MNLRGLHMLSLVFAGSVFALTGLKQFFIEPAANPAANIISFWIFALPIVLIVPGMLRLSPRSYLFAALAGMFYFCHGVWLAASPDLRTFGIWQAGFAVALIATATFALRELNRGQ